MKRILSPWMNTAPLVDVLEREQAQLLHGFLLLGVVSGLLSVPLVLATPAPWSVRVGIAIGFVLPILTQVYFLRLLRRGHVQRVALLSAVFLVIFTSLTMIPSGLSGGKTLLLLFTLPVVIVGLITDQWRTWLIVGMSIASVVILTLLEQIVPALVGFTAPLRNSLAVSAVEIGVFTIVLGVVGFFTSRFGKAWRAALAITREREQELIGLSASLELAVAERTAKLQESLATLEQREAHLAQTLAHLQSSRVLLRELSAPVLPVLPGVLVVPLSGALEQEHLDSLMEHLLQAVEHERAQYLIIDITGLSMVDTHIARVLLDTTTAMMLLGTQVVLVGMRPELAQTLVSLAVPMHVLSTFADLRQAVAWLLHKQETKHGKTRVVSIN